MRLKLAVVAVVALVGTVAWVGRRRNPGLRRDWKPADQAATDRLYRALRGAGYQ